MNKYRAAVVGTGRIGFNLENDRLREQPASHASALSSNPRISLVAGCDIDKKTLKKFSKKYPYASTYTEVGKLLQSEKPDIVSIAVDESAHLDVIRAVCRFQPRLIILEKPISPNLDDARKISSTCRRRNIPVVVNHERRFSLDYIEAQRLLTEGRIGTPQAIRANLWSGSVIWKKSAREDGSCSLLHDGTHLIDIIHFLLGTEVSKPSLDHITKNPKGEIDSLFCHALAKKIFVGLEFCGNKRVFDFGIEITGSEGKISIGNGYFKVYTRKPSPFYSGFYSLMRDGGIKRPKKTGYFSRMVANCVEFLDGKADLISPLSEGMKTMKVLYRIADLID